MGFMKAEKIKIYGGKFFIMTIHTLNRKKCLKLNWRNSIFSSINHLTKKIYGKSGVVICRDTEKQTNEFYYVVNSFDC